MEASVVAIALSVIFIATFTRSAIGFGDGLIEMPLLTLLVGIKVATPVVGLIATTLSLTILMSAWRKVSLFSAWRLILSAFFGIPVGLYVLTSVPENIVRTILGIILTLFGLYSLFRPQLPKLENENSAYAFGFIAGILGGAYNINGPPAVIYGTLSRWHPSQFRATLQAFFLPTGFMIMVGHGLAGLWTRDVFTLYLTALPIIMAAVWIGAQVNGRISVERFSKIVYGFLVIIGLTMILGT